ncbi:hypothetical protein LWI29_012692 [Acer saccharum]|uniref:Uncharacterized protein n=1 Tax=Acer saccharum TaxID=4024 RepID=A0AA39VMZ7_ACESA|nr:hypothetical protein LWI29_012692 [Acer saccharum]
MSESALSSVISCTTSFEAWDALEKLFSSQSQARTLQLRMQLQTSKKNASSVSEYFVKMKCIADNLSATGNPITEEDLLLYLLAGIGSDYDPVVVNVTARTDNLTLHEVYALLLNHESRMEQLAATTNIDTQTGINVNYAQIGQNQKGPGGRGSGFGVNRGYHRGRGRWRSNTGRNNGKPTCQICNKYGHATSVCCYRFSQEISNKNTNNQT